MELKKAIARWKELNVDRVVLTFNCGGDSMGDMDWEVFDTDDNSIEDEDLISYFDREVFNRVDFYVNSDGHYIGESGTVTILLEDDMEAEQDFIYNKEAYSDYSESHESTVLIELTDAEVAYIKEYIRDINGGAEERVNINYSKDFIMTDEMVELEASISEKIGDFTSQYMPEDIEEDGQLDDWYNFNTDDFDPIEFEGNSIKVTINNSVTVQRYSENW
jgi:hypothetical protein